MYVVVIRNEQNGQHSILRHASLESALRRALYKCKTNKRPPWASDAVDHTIKKHYKQDMTASALADLLSSEQRRVTKNMVVGRARYLGVGGKKRGLTCQPNSGN